MVTIRFFRKQLNRLFVRCLTVLLVIGAFALMLLSLPNASSVSQAKSSLTHLPSISDAAPLRGVSLLDAKTGKEISAENAPVTVSVEKVNPLFARAFGSPVKVLQDAGCFRSRPQCQVVSQYGVCYTGVAYEISFTLAAGVINLGSCHPGQAKFIDMTVPGVTSNPYPNQYILRVEPFFEFGPEPFTVHIKVQAYQQSTGQAIKAGFYIDIDPGNFPYPGSCTPATYITC
jgi:hypothetical protein